MNEYRPPEAAIGQRVVHPHDQEVSSPYRTAAGGTSAANGTSHRSANGFISDAAVCSRTSEPLTYTQACSSAAPNSPGLAGPSTRREPQCGPVPAGPFVLADRFALGPERGHRDRRPLVDGRVRREPLLLHPGVERILAEHPRAERRRQPVQQRLPVGRHVERLAVQVFPRAPAADSPPGAVDDDFSAGNVNSPKSAGSSTVFADDDADHADSPSWERLTFPARTCRASRIPRRASGTGPTPMRPTGLRRRRASPRKSTRRTSPGRTCRTAGRAGL